MRRYLIAGLLVWVPLGITLWVLHFLVAILDQSLLLLPEHVRPDALIGFHIPGLGVVLSFLILLVTGVVAANFFGARLILLWEALLGRIPFVKSIYSSVKQVSDTLLSEKGNAFRKALLVEYPREGSWTIAFHDRHARRRRRAPPAGRARQRLRADHAEPDVRLFPDAAAQSRVHELDMTVDEALKYIISMGVVAPGGVARTHRRRGSTASPVAKLTGPARRRRPSRARPARVAGPPRSSRNIPEQLPEQHVKRTDYCGRIDRRFSARPSR